VVVGSLAKGLDRKIFDMKLMGCFEFYRSIEYLGIAEMVCFMSDQAIDFCSDKPKIQVVSFLL
jgi:hypothetical protein